MAATAVSRYTVRRVNARISYVFRRSIHRCLFAIAFRMMPIAGSSEETTTSASTISDGCMRASCRMSPPRRILTVSAAYPSIVKSIR